MSNLNTNIIKYSTDALTTEEIYNLLVNFNISNDSHTDYIRKPNGGEVYLFYKEKGVKDYTVDDYKWKNMGSRFLPESTKLIRVTYHDAIPGNEVPSTASKLKYYISIYNI